MRGAPPGVASVAGQYPPASIHQAAVRAMLVLGPAGEPLFIVIAAFCLLLFLYLYECCASVEIFINLSIISA